MPKEYKNDQRLKDYVELNISKIDGIDEKFRPLIVDVMLRRFSEFSFNMPEVYQDMLSLVNNLKGVEIGKIPGAHENAAGLYFYDSRKILISEDFVKNARTQEDFNKIYEIFTHEVFHALARDEHGEAKISTKNTYTQYAFHSLEEAIVEKAADRCVYGRKWNEKNAPFFHQNKFGYTDITYITDIIESTYGVTEKEFLRHAIQGRKKAEVFLADVSGETPEDVQDYLDRVELNYSTLHKSLYESKKSREENANIIKDAMTAGLLVSSWKLNENIEKLDINDPQFLKRIENLKYAHNKMFLVSRDAAENFEKRFGGNIKEYVLNQIHYTREDNSYRINTLSEILRKKQEIPEEDFHNLIEATKKGQRTFEGEDFFKKYQISQTAPDYIPLDSESYIEFRRLDFELTDWDNREISSELQVFKEVYENMNKKSLRTTLKNSFDKLKEVFKKKFQFFKEDVIETKMLESGDSKNIENKSSSFGKLSPEELQRFTEGMNQVISSHSEISKEENIGTIHCNEDEKEF